MTKTKTKTKRIQTVIQLYEQDKTRLTKLVSEKRIEADKAGKRQPSMSEVIRTLIEREARRYDIE